MVDESEMGISQRDLGISPDTTTDHSFLSFEEVPLDPSWEGDMSSPERQVAINGVVRMLEVPLDKTSKLAHLGEYKTEYPHGRGPIRSHLDNIKFVRIGEENDLPGQTPFAKKVTGYVGVLDTSVKKWEIPRGEAEPPLDIFLRIKGSPNGDLKAGDPFIASIDGQPASRSDVERARNNIGTFFKQAAAGQQAGKVV